MTDRRTPREPLSRRLGVILALIVLGYTTFVFSQADEALNRVDNESAERQEKDDLTFEVICLRQETGLRLSKEVRTFVRTTDSILYDLVAISISPEAIAAAEAEKGPLNAREREVLLQFRQKGVLLQNQIKKIRKGEIALQVALDGLDCEDLPPEQVAKEDIRQGSK